MKILITGSAGFIGFHAVQEFSRRGWDVIGVDDFNGYYDVQLKRDREAMLSCLRRYRGIAGDICDYERLREIFLIEKPDVVLNLAAQPGVRYSITNPFVYQKTNVEGFLNVLECCRCLFASLQDPGGIMPGNPPSRANRAEMIFVARTVGIWYH